MEPVAWPVPAPFPAHHVPLQGRWAASQVHHVRIPAPCGRLHAQRPALVLAALALVRAVPVVRVLVRVGVPVVPVVLVVPVAQVVPVVPVAQVVPVVVAASVVALVVLAAVPVVPAAALRVVPAVDVPALVDVAAQPAHSVARVASRLAVASPSGPSGKSSTTCVHRKSVAFELHVVSAK